MTLTFALALGLLACGGDTDEATSDDHASQEDGKKKKSKAIKIKVDKEFDDVKVTCCGHERLDQVLGEYLDIQQNLAADTVKPGDAYALHGHAKSIVDGKLTGGDTLTAAQAMVDAAAKIKDADLEGTRAGFADLSAAMQGIVESRAGQGSTEVAMVECPMEKGGIWYQSDTEIKNPYYGSEMLACGAFK